jgi:predicted DNA-binding transcriptional regulator AlpA
MRVHALEAYLMNREAKVIAVKVVSGGMLVVQQGHIGMDTQASPKQIDDDRGVDDQLLSAKTCAATLEIAKSTWWAWVANPAFPVRPIRYGGRFTRFKRSQLAAWMASLEGGRPTKQLALRSKQVGRKRAGA